MNKLNAFALLHAQQMDRISAQGAWMEFNPFAVVDESTDALRTAVYHVQGPAAINALLHELLSPVAIVCPSRVQEAGIGALQKLLVFGIRDSQNGDFFISQIFPSAASDRRSVFP